MIHLCFVLFLVCLYVCVCEYLLHNMRIFTSNPSQYSYIWGPLQEYRSIRSGASGLPYYCTPLVCISTVIELLPVWRYNKPKTKNHCGSTFEPGASGLLYYCTSPVCVPAVLGALTVWRQNNKMKKNMDLLLCLFPISMKKNGTRSGDNTSPKIIHTQQGKSAPNRTLSPFIQDLTGDLTDAHWYTHAPHLQPG